MSERTDILAQLDEAGYSVDIRNGKFLTADSGDIHIAAHFTPEDGVLERAKVYNGLDTVAQIEYGTSKAERLVIQIWLAVATPADETRHS